MHPETPHAARKLDAKVGNLARELGKSPVDTQQKHLIGEISKIITKGRWRRYDGIEVDVEGVGFVHRGMAYALCRFVSGHLAGEVLLVPLTGSSAFMRPVLREEKGGTHEFVRFTKADDEHFLDD